MSQKCTIIDEKSESVDFMFDSSMLGNEAFDTDMYEKESSTEGRSYEDEFQPAADNPRKRKYST